MLVKYTVCVNNVLSSRFSCYTDKQKFTMRVSGSDIDKENYANSTQCSTLHYFWLAVSIGWVNFLSLVLRLLACTTVRLIITTLFTVTVPRFLIKKWNDSLTSPRLFQPYASHDSSHTLARLWAWQRCPVSKLRSSWTDCCYVTCRVWMTPLSLLFGFMAS